MADERAVVLWSAGAQTPIMTQRDEWRQTQPELEKGLFELKSGVLSFE